MAPSRPHVIAVGLAAMMLLSVVAPTGAIVGTAAAQTNETAVTEDVSIWQQSAIPLRVDGSNAATTVTNPSLGVKIEGTGETSIDKNAYAFNTGSSVEVNFSARSGMSSIPSEYQGDAQVVVARLNTDVTGLTALAELVLAEANASDAQDLAAIKNVKNTSITDGSFTESVSPDEAGHYAVIAVTGQNLKQNGDDLTLNGETTIVGVDTFAAQSGPSTVTAPDHVTPGENATFTVNSDISNADHTLVLYDADTYESQTFTLDVDENNMSDLQTGEIALNHSLKYVSGTVALDSNLSVTGLGLNSSVSPFGATINGSMSGTISFGAAIDRSLAAATTQNGTNFSAIETRSTGNDTLRLSAAGETGADGETKLVVQTGEDWSGDFRWVHVASDNAGDQLQTNSGTVQVSDDTTSPTLSFTRPKKTVFDAGREKIKFVARYSDNVGIDQSSVTLTFTTPNGTTEVTDAATIGGQRASYTATGLRNNTTYTFSASLSDAAGNPVSNSITVSINASPETDEGEESPGGGGGGGGFIGIGIGDDDDDDGEEPTGPGEGPGQGSPPVTVEPTPDGTGAQVNINTSGQGGQFTAEFNGTGTAVAEPGNDGISLERLSGSVSGDGSITVRKGKEADVPDLTDDENDVLGYLNIEEQDGTEASEVTFTFTVQKDRLEQRGITSENVSLYRYNGGEWTELETSQVGETNTAFRYESVSPGFSTFAVAREDAQQQEEPTTTTTTTTTMTNTTTVGEEQGGFGLAPLLIFLLLGGGGAGGYFAWRRGLLDGLLGNETETTTESETISEETETTTEPGLDEESGDETDPFDEDK